MNILATIAGVLVLIAAGVHAIVGGKEFSFIKPVGTGKPRAVWSQALCGWHWVSIDQLFVSALLFIIGLTEAIQDEAFILLIIGGYFALIGVTWLVTALISGRELERAWLQLGQWIYCFLITGLVLGAR